MQTGHESKPLSARLSEQMQAQQRDQAALLGEASKSFENAIRTTFNDALATTKADIHAHHAKLRQSLDAELSAAKVQLDTARRIIRWRPVTLAATILLSSTLTLAGCWLWVRNLPIMPGQSAPAEIDPSHPYLLIDTQTGNITRCRSTPTSFVCSQNR